MNNPKENIEKLIEEKGCQFRDFRLTNIEKRSAEDGKDELIVEGKACTFNEETVLYSSNDYEAREVIDPNAFQNCDMNDVIFNFNHCGRVYARTRNNTLSLEVREDGLYMKATLRADDNGHKELYNDIATGTIDKMSFAFTVSDSEWNYKQVDGKDIDTRTIKGINRLYDVSAVDIPAYNTTSISVRSLYESVRETRSAESRKKAEELELEKQKLLLLLKIKE